jgi:hypothetical protein
MLSDGGPETGETDDQIRALKTNLSPGQRVTLVGKPLRVDSVFATDRSTFSRLYLRKLDVKPRLFR